MPEENEGRTATHKENLGGKQTSDFLPSPGGPQLWNYSEKKKKKRCRENEEQYQRPLPNDSTLTNWIHKRNTSSRLSSITLMCIDCLYAAKYCTKGLSEAKNLKPDKQGRYTAWV